MELSGGMLWTIAAALNAASLELSWLNRNIYFRMDGLHALQFHH
jgi:hypothetical protein